MTDQATDADREAVFFGIPAETSFGYAQAVRVGDTIHISGQLGWDEGGTLRHPAPLGSDGRPSSFDAMADQMRDTYVSAQRVLARFGATLDDVVSETLFVLDVDAAFAVARKIREAAYGKPMPQVASNIFGITRLAFPEQLIEITFVAVVRRRK